MKRFSLLFVLIATCAYAQAQTPQVLKSLKTPTYRGLLPKTDEYKLLLSSLPEDDEVVRYRFISGSGKKRRTNDWVVIPQQNTGLSDAPIDDRFYANVWFLRSSTNKGRIEFSVGPKVVLPEAPLPVAVTNWSTVTVIGSISPFDTNQLVLARLGQRYSFAAMRLTGNGIFKGIRWIQGGIMLEGPPKNPMVEVIDSLGRSVSIPAPTTDGLYFTANSVGILIEGYIDVVFIGDIPSNTLPGRYVLAGIWLETDIVVQDAAGSRLHVVPLQVEELNDLKSEFCTEGKPAFLHGSKFLVK